MLTIEMARGDRETRTFTVKNEDNTPFIEEFDNIYFTVKRNAKDKGYRFQKKLSDGGITGIGESKYVFTIMPEDTNDLEFGDYEFDIELVIDGQLKKTFVGVLHLTKEVTHMRNEVIADG